MAVHRRLMAESAAYRATRAQIEERTRGYLAGRDAQQLPDVAHVPVVVHVVSAADEQDVSDEQVTSQIEVLDRDFRGANPDVSILPPAFAPLVADSRVEFSLAPTDPAGASTTGITRTRTTVASFTVDDAVKRASTGGVDAWPADRYLNIWVCQLAGGLLGYAQFPGGPADTDGVVVTHTAFGTTGTATPPFHLGRTATHEVGHFLNLFHIWGDDGTGCDGTDEVDDTPDQAGENTGVPRFPHVTCDNGPDGDLFYDYMDYSDDQVLVLFTHGQAARVQACLADVRSSLMQPAPAATPRPTAPVPVQREPEVPAAPSPGPGTGSDTAAGVTGRWLHAFEEDHGDVTVYRPAGADLPRARGRRGIEFTQNGSFTEWAVGRGDAPQPLPGRWRRVNAQRLQVSTGRGEERVLEVVQLTPDRLEARWSTAP
ncbi:zinc metalloprotease [Geodermatophilus sp. TF02-6]|nr:zinc metalloprotease [Geodermatophilus sp. TF02-6]